MRALAVALATALLTAGSAAAQNRDDQWHYSVVEGDGPTAAFLSWNLNQVLFRVRCEGATLAVIYHGADGAPAEGETMALLLDDQPLSLRMRRAGERLEGRLTLDARSRQRIAAATRIDIDAENETGDPWYTGSGAGLKRVAAGCPRP